MQSRSILLVASAHFNWLGLEAALRQRPDLCVLAIAHDGATAQATTDMRQPTFIVVAADLDLEDTSLGGLVRVLHAASPTSKIGVIGRRLDYRELATLATLKLSWYLEWEDVSAEKICRILALVEIADVRVASESVAEEAVIPDHRRRECDLLAGLTPKEMAVFEGLAKKQTREQIAANLRIGLRTVEDYVASIKRKLDAPTPFMLGVMAERAGFIP